MPTQTKAPIIRYRYDAQDRLVGHGQSDTVERQRFYGDSQLTTEIDGDETLSIVQHGDQLLAQQRRQGGEVRNSVLATDLQRSVLSAQQANSQRAIAYSPYGFHLCDSGLASVLGFNGQRPEPVTGHYLLGNGYRAFNPVLMRFNSPDSLSPFGKGGLNAYGYCLGDPVNRSDSTGRISIGLGELFSSLRTFYESYMAGYPVKPARNVIRLSEKIFAFEDTYKNKTRLTFQGHGSQKTHLLKFDKHRSIDAAELYEVASSKGLHVKNYEYLRIAACYLGDPTILPGGDIIPSFAEKFSVIASRPVKAFQGSLDGDDVSKLFPGLEVGGSSKRVKYLGLYKKKHPYNPVIYGAKIRTS
ncbi:RHS repeat-associated core domain-containing protein [Pseudomonas sp. NPDC086251]|jgi:RHS repeat-associated protein|uniref:RHS repeat-associated core domain-containing protein n=1 Tax=Pseudomonas sp. NPDC086251 TaxID=3364431 RepID=UPI003835DAC3